MEQEVNEATAQLKGLLGIGAAEGAGKAPAKQGRQEDEQQQTSISDLAPSSGEPVTVVPKANNQKNKRNRKNKKDNKEQQQPQQQQKDKGEGSKQQQENRPHSKSPSTIPPKDGNKQKVKGKGNKSKKNSKDSKEKDKNKSNVSTNNKNLASIASTQPGPNFAWSAFQSSPDASKLPIPAFSPANNKNLVEVDDEAAQQQALSSLLPVAPNNTTEIPPSLPYDLSNAPHAEELEEQQIAQAERHTAERVEEGKVKEEDEAAPASHTGINLAALASSKTNTPASATASPSDVSIQQQTQHLPPYPPRGPNLPPQYQHHLGNPYGGHPMQHHQQTHAYPPPPPQGFVTIQVQVPPVLMPGRQMVVTSPAGYPVRVVVPEGIPPGMVIPVHVPTALPLHMMSPQQQQAYQQQQLQQQQQRFFHSPGR